MISVIAGATLRLTLCLSTNGSRYELVIWRRGRAGRTARGFPRPRCVAGPNVGNATRGEPRPWRQPKAYLFSLDNLLRGHAAERGRLADASAWTHGSRRAAVVKGVVDRLVSTDCNEATAR
ncbi:hypothetical protein EVAR_65528_1 [Eumeta japonica]|uniref:Uncharacterized protein n=1 Tax=Eumeta variegata TaxID=151549 RepID=A0A4C1ZRT1_EUMVA|nr:hypothetical protein EVAR_65528_1 [Eumeta japonica]